MNGPASPEWIPATPHDAKRWLGLENGLLWWVAGGWAIDLHVGRQTRKHDDLDVGCYRGDFVLLRDRLGGWELFGAHQGRLRRLSAQDVPSGDENSVWCREPGDEAWRLEVLLDKRDGPNWVYRRYPEITLPAGTHLLRSADGTPYLRPEIQLLFKAKHRRPKDDGDLDVVLPLLDEEQRAWLGDALERTQPGHVWLERFL